MPSKTPKQKRFMQIVAHDPSFARKVGVSQSVGEEFSKADEATSRPDQWGSAMERITKKRKK